MSSIIDYVKIAEHCQRNWQDKPVDQNIINSVLKVCTTMPTKQNNEYYSVLVVTDPKHRHEINMLCVNDGDDTTIYANTQMSAPVLILYFETKGRLRPGSHDILERTENDNYSYNAGLAISMSAGAAAIEAAANGLNTGFCKCFLTNELQTYLHENVAMKSSNPKLHIANKDNGTVELLIGLGYGLEHTPHNKVFYNENHDPVWNPNSKRWGLRKTYRKKIITHQV